MIKFSTSTKVDADADALFKVILNVEDFPNYINGLREVKRVKRNDDGVDEVSALITVRYFTGRVSARVKGDAVSRLIHVDFVKGPFQIARAKISISDTDSSNRCSARYDIEYATPIAIYSSLIERHRQSALERLSAMFARRSQTVLF